MVPGLVLAMVKEIDSQAALEASAAQGSGVDGGREGGASHGQGISRWR